MKYVVILIANLTPLLRAVCIFRLHCNYLHILIQVCVGSIEPSGTSYRVVRGY